MRGFGVQQRSLSFQAFESLVQEHGLPTAIRSDNNVPFASPNGLFKLSRIVLWKLDAVDTLTPDILLAVTTSQAHVSLKERAELSSPCLKSTWPNRA